MKDSFEDLGDDEFAEIQPETSKKQTVVKQEVRESVFAPELDWTVNTGMQNHRLSKLYSLFTDKHSLFHLGKDVSVLDEHLSGAASFQSKHNDQQIHLYTPSHSYVAVYNTDTKDGAGDFYLMYDGSPTFEDRLAEMAKHCATATMPTTFVLPYMEMPQNMSKGVQHQVLLTVTYDPQTKQMTPVVYDSIGRDTYTESFSTFWKSKQRSTSDELLNIAIKKAAAKHAPELTVNELSRAAYNHQNRLTEGNCGSYTFRTIKEVISSAANGTSVSIPGSGYLSSDSFLTSQHVQEIEGCIKYRTLKNSEINTSLTTGNSLPVGLSEFISALHTYEESRGKKPEKSMLNFGYSKEAKTKAVSLLAGILQDIKDNKEIEPSQYRQLAAQFNCLMDGSLGSLISFHLNKQGFKTLNELVLPSLKEEEFVLVDDEGLFDVDEIDESELARQTVVLPNKADVNATAIENQKQIKTGLEEIRHEITGENEDDLDEFVFVK